MAVPAPDAHTLLPPLLSCLPTAFVSNKAPPALLPLLSPILRQRVNLFSGNTSSGDGGWLTLLSWDPKRASKLATKVESLHFEPHPVSGELEVEEIEMIAYRRLDQETFQSRLELTEFDLLPVYVWCENDDGGSGWRLAELRSLEDREDGTEWFETVAEANAASSSQTRRASVKAPPPPPSTDASAASASTEAEHEDDDEDDDYWAAYDRTPGRTPARTPVRRSPVPTTTKSPFSGPSADELAYFARYASEVQPALDSHDPDEPEIADGSSTLTGEELTRGGGGVPATAPAPAVSASTSTNHNHVTFDDDDNNDQIEEAKEEKEEEEIEGRSPYDPTALPPAYAPAGLDVAPTFSEGLISAPRARSPSNSSTGSVERLEQGAQEMTRAEVGVKQFVSTEIKSLFRLAKTVGIERAEFERMVRTELEVLGMMEVDE